MVSVRSNNENCEPNLNTGKKISYNATRPESTIISVRNSPSTTETNLPCGRRSVTLRLTLQDDSSNYCLPNDSYNKLLEGGQKKW